MHCAVRGGKEDIVQLVIRNSSKINVKSKDGKTALDLAVDKFSHLRPLIEEARLQKIPWKEIKAEGKSPIPRSGHSASPYNNRWYIYGGANDLLDPVTIFDDILFFNGDTHEWRFLNPAQGKDGRPPALYLHSSVIISGKLYIFGGMDLSKVYNDIWVLDLGTFFSSYLFFLFLPVPHFFYIFYTSHIFHIIFAFQLHSLFPRPHRRFLFSIRSLCNMSIFIACSS